MAESALSRSALGICLGDITGIGPEVTLKALRGTPGRFVLIGDPAHLHLLNRRLGLRLPLTLGMGSGPLAMLNPLTTLLPPGLLQGAPQAAQAALASLRVGAKLCLDKKLQGLVTAPVNKESIIRSGEKKFIGQTEFLSQLSRTSKTRMMLLGSNREKQWIRVMLVTTHLPIRKVAAALTSRKISETISLSLDACGHLGLRRPRIAVCGLNPHAGEGGKVGTEELTLIAPAIRRARSRGWPVFGPFSADTLFYQALQGDYDVVVAMYHDQGLIPVKLIGFENGVNWTVGLPFIRTSPDHGTAYDIAGKGIADDSSMRSAIALARQLAQR